MDKILQLWILLSFIMTGMLCGATLDQSIKQLPARRRIGTIAYSAFIRAADLKYGLPYYAFLGIGSTAASIMAAITTVRNEIIHTYDWPIYLSAVFAIVNLALSAVAVPLFLNQKKVSEKQELKKLLDKFEQIQTFRSICIVLCFLCNISVVAIAIC